MDRHQSKQERSRRILSQVSLKYLLSIIRLTKQNTYNIRGKSWQNKNWLRITSLAIALAFIIKATFQHFYMCHVMALNVGVNNLSHFVYLIKNSLWKRLKTLGTAERVKHPRFRIHKDVLAPWQPKLVLIDST